MWGRLPDASRAIGLQACRRRTPHRMDSDLGSGRFRDFELSPDAFPVHQAYSERRSRSHGSAFHPRSSGEARPDGPRRRAEVIEDTVIGLYDELTREMLDRRYDEMESGTQAQYRSRLPRSCSPRQVSRLARTTPLSCLSPSEAVMACPNRPLRRHGILRFSSSRKFSSMVTCTVPFSPGGVSGGANTTKRFPSGARSRLTVPVKNSG
jgi:hypothetical protein